MQKNLGLRAAISKARISYLSYDVIPNREPLPCGVSFHFSIVYQALNQLAIEVVFANPSHSGGTSGASKKCH
jgi:hypothetical protein